jgi:predicted nucleic acid-binding protein
MIVADSSALISLGSADSLELTLKEFEIHTTETVIGELEETSEYEDLHERAAEKVLENLEKIEIHEVHNQKFQSSRIDKGEGSCITLTQQKEADFLITDDMRALPELQTVSDTKVAISPIILKALVKREVISNSQAKERLEKAAENRDWLGSPIYRKAKDLF